MNARKYDRLRKHQLIRKCYKLLVPHRHELAKMGLMLVSPSTHRVIREAQVSTG